MGDLVIKVKRRDFWIAFSVLVLFVGVGFAVGAGVDPAVMGHEGVYIDDKYVELRDDAGATFRAGVGGVSGEYGTVQTEGNGKSGWEGYSINGRAVFMHDGASGVGIYNDVNNEWMMYGVRNSYMGLYYNGVRKIETTSAGAKVTGNLQVTGSLTVGGVSVGVASACVPGTTQVISGLCIDSSLQAVKKHYLAEYECFKKGGHICTYNEIYVADISKSIISRTKGMWLGDTCGDDSRLFVNNDNTDSNFEGCANKGDDRKYRCCYSRF